jgi:DNA-binding transcriptional LysR family regulator
MPSGQSENLMKRSMRGEFDLAFFKQETGAKNGTVALREQLVWVSGPNYSGDDNQSVPLILFPEGCAYRRFAIAALKDHRRAWHLSFVSPSFECLKSAAVEGMGITVLARALVTPPLRIVRHGMRLPQLPTARESGYVGTVADNIARYHRKNRRPLKKPINVTNPTASGYQMTTKRGLSSVQFVA